MGKLRWASFTSRTAPVYNVIVNKKKKTATLQYSIYAACKQHCSIHYIITCVVVFFHFLFFFSRARGEDEEYRMQHTDLEPRIIILRFLFRGYEQTESSACG